MTGQVVAVNEADGTITFYTEDGICTVAFESEFDHPVVNLLGKYFSNINIEDLVSTMEPTTGWILFDEASNSWLMSDETTEGAVSAFVLGVSELGDGSFEITMQIGEDIITMLTDDPDLAAEYIAALDANSVNWDLRTDENGVVTILDAGGQIADYHASGMGLGVLVKLFDMAANSVCELSEDGEPCEAINIETLVSEFQDGTGLGLLFKDYGKPENTGVGQIYKALDENPGKALGLTKQEEVKIKAEKEIKVKNENSSTNNSGGKKK